MGSGLIRPVASLAAPSGTDHSMSTAENGIAKNGQEEM